MQDSTIPSTAVSEAPFLTTLHDGRPGVRALMQVETREPESSSVEAGAGSAVLDFVASRATLDRYHDVIEPAGWRLEA